MGAAAEQHAGWWRLEVGKGTEIYSTQISTAGVSASSGWHVRHSPTPWAKMLCGRGPAVMVRRSVMEEWGFCGWRIRLQSTVYPLHMNARILIHTARAGVPH